MVERRLYNREGVIIEVNERNPEEHDIYLGRRGDYALLQRGILQEAAVSDLARTRNMFEVYAQGLIPFHLQEAQIPFEHFALALSQARIAELELELGSRPNWSGLVNPNTANLGTCE